MARQKTGTTSEVAKKASRGKAQNKPKAAATAPSTTAADELLKTNAAAKRPATSGRGPALHSGSKDPVGSSMADLPKVGSAAARAPDALPKPPEASVTNPTRKATPPVLANSSAKKRRRRPEEVRERILASALVAFATYGFEGASVRSIAKDAHVSLPLVLYHFHSKEELWKTMMEGVYAEIDNRQLDHPDFANLSASERLRLLIGDIVRFFANSPLLHRLMTLEGHQITDRLLWMCERHTRKSFRDMTTLIAEAQKEGNVRMVDPARLRFAINAMSAVPFAVSAEYQVLTNKSPYSQDEIEGSIALINQFVFIDGN